MKCFVASRDILRLEKFLGPESCSRFFTSREVTDSWVGDNGSPLHTYDNNINVLLLRDTAPDHITNSCSSVCAKSKALRSTVSLLRRISCTTFSNNAVCSLVANPVSS